VTQDMVKALSDDELVQVVAWAQGEQRERAELRKRETIAKIRQMAESVGVSVSIGGVRGRPKAVDPGKARNNRRP